MLQALQTLDVGIAFNAGLAIVVARRKPATSLIDLESMKLETYSLSVYGASVFRIAVSVLPAPAPRMPVFVAGARAYFRAVRAMHEHRSQLVWFRRLYVLFSRYMWVDEWVEIPARASKTIGES